MLEQLASLPGLLVCHLQLSLMALLVGAACSVPAGVWVARRRRLQAVVLGTASLIQTIPSLALLAMMVPALAYVGQVCRAHFGAGPSSIGYLPALIALTLYSMLPILRNTTTAMAAVDPALLEAALGVGMTRTQRLWRVELPQALPTIVAGLRTATVWVVGMTTLSTPVGAPSLGNYIFTGLQTRNFAAVSVGCMGAAVVALSLDAGVRAVEVALRRRRRLALRLVLGGWVALYAFVGALSWPHAGAAAAQLRIGAKSFTEQYILGELLAEQVRQRCGRQVLVMPSLGSHVAYDALRDGALDLYVEYTGTLWSTRMDSKPAGLSRDATLAAVKRFVEADGQVHFGPRLGFENTYALAVGRSTANRLHLQSIADLAPHAPFLRLGSDYEFLGRAEWPSLQRGYGLHFNQTRAMDPALLYEAAEAGAVDVVTAYTTDGRMEAFDLQVLTDPRQIVPPYDAVVLSGQRAFGDACVSQALADLEGRISSEAMRRMNAAVDVEGRSPAAVARQFVGKR